MYKFFMKTPGVYHMVILYFIAIIFINSQGTETGTKSNLFVQLIINQINFLS